MASKSKYVNHGKVGAMGPNAISFQLQPHADAKAVEQAIQLAHAVQANNKQDSRQPQQQQMENHGTVAVMGAGAIHVSVGDQPVYAAVAGIAGVPPALPRDAPPRHR